MAPNINNPGGVKNDPDEIRDGVVSDATRFPGGFIDQRLTQAGAPVQFIGQFQLDTTDIIQSFDVSSQATNPRGLSFSPDGEFMYVIDNDSDTIQRYNLSTGFDISTASSSQSFSVRQQDNEPQGVAIKPDGSRLYFAGTEFVNVYQYNLSTAFDMSTASFSQSFDVSDAGSSPQSVVFDSAGTRMITSDDASDSVTRFSLSTSFDISTASFESQGGIGTQDGQVRSAVFNSDGTKMFIVGTQNDNAYQYSLSSSFDVFNKSFTTSLNVGQQGGQPQGIAFKPDGTQFYMVSRTSQKVHQYKVGELVEEF